MKQTLGKGLQSLIPKKESKITGLIKDKNRAGSWMKPRKESVFNVEIDKIRPNPNQPRKDLSEEGLKELAESIIQHGVLQPLIVAKVEKPTERGQQVEYELIAGERRWRASQKAGLPHVPVIIRDSAAQQRLEIALVENIQRENLNAIEAAMAYKRLQDDFNLRHKDIARKVGKSRTTITNTLRLLTLPTKAQEALAAGKINEGHGRAILMAKPAAQESLFQTLVKNGLSVRQMEQRARKLALENKPQAKGPKSPLFQKIEGDLRKILGRQVTIIKRGDKHFINIEFVNQKELNRLANYLSKI